MTPDLDQTLSLKAQLKDQVTPILKKIERNTQTTSDALLKLTQSFEDSGERVGRSTTSMADRVGENLNKVKSHVQGTQASFREFGDEANQSSRKIGQALEDALYTAGAEKRLGDLGKDLSGLDRVFGAMASRQRAVSGKARILQAISRDNINKKVIPAFQELHGTLDKYPDTLENINKLEEDRLKLLDDGGTTLGRVEGRLKGFSAAAEEIKFGVQDALSLVTAGAFGAVGMRVQDQQRTVGQLAGTEAFTQTPALLQATTMQARTTMNEIEPFYETIKDLRSISDEMFPSYVAGMVDIQKATGMAGEEIEVMRDQLMRLGAVKLPDYVEVMDTAAYLSQTSTASMGDMSETIQVATVRMLDFAEAQRKTFLQQSMAAAATAKDMGMQADTYEDLRQTLLHSDEAYARLSGLFRNAGVTTPMEELVRNPAKLADAMRQLAKAYDIDLSSRGGVRFFENVMAPAGISEDLFRLARNDVVTTGEGTGGTAMERLAQIEAGKAEGTIGDTAQKIRGLFSEQMEQAQSKWQSFAIPTGEKLIKGAAKVVEKFNEYLDLAIKTFQKLDAKLGGKLTTAMAIGIGVKAGWSLLRGVAKGAGALGLPIPKFMTATGPIGGAMSAMGLGPGGGMGSFIKRILVIGGLAFGAKKGYDYLQERKVAKTLTPEKLDELIELQKKQIAEMKGEGDPLAAGSKARRQLLLRELMKRREEMTPKTPQTGLQKMVKGFLFDILTPFNELRPSFQNFIKFLKFEARELAEFMALMTKVVYMEIDKIRFGFEVLDYLFTGSHLILDNAKQKIVNWAKEIVTAFDAMLEWITKKVEKVLKFFGIERQEKKEPTHKNLSKVRESVEAGLAKQPKKLSIREQMRRRTKAMELQLDTRHMSAAELAIELDKPVVEPAPGGGKKRPASWDSDETVGNYLTRTMLGESAAPPSESVTEAAAAAASTPTAPTPDLTTREGVRYAEKIGAATRLEIPAMTEVAQVGAQQRDLLTSAVEYLRKIVDNTSPNTSQNPVDMVRRTLTPGTIRAWDWEAAGTGR